MGYELASYSNSTGTTLRPCPLAGSPRAIACPAIRLACPANSLSAYVLSVILPSSMGYDMLMHERPTYRKVKHERLWTWITLAFCPGYPVFDLARLAWRWLISGHNQWAIAFASAK